MKRFGTLLACIILLVAIILVPAGCSSSNTQSTTTVPSSMAIPPASTQAAVKPIELKFGHQNPPASRTSTELLIPWAKKVEDATKGRVKITMYPSQSLFKASNAIDAIEGDIGDITWVINTFAGRFPLEQISELPFMALPSGHVNGKETYMSAVNSQILEEWYETSPELQKEFSGVKVLFMYTPGPNYIFTINKPVRNMQDLQGLRLEVRPGPATDAMKLLGVSPSNVAAPAEYESLQKGIIDGVTMPWAGVLSFRLYELLKYQTMESPLNGSIFMLMNKDKFNSFPKDIQDEIMSVSGMQGVDMATSLGGPSEQADAMSTIKKAGLTMEQVDLDAGQWDKMEEIGGKPVWKSYLDGLQAKGLPAQKAFDELTAIQAKYK